MTEEEPQETPQEQPTEQPPEQPQEQPTEQEEKQAGYEGKNFVEFSPEQLKRINSLTKESKSWERKFNELDRIAREQYEVINELRNGQTTIVKHLQEKDFTNVEATLKDQRKAAYDRGDLNEVDNINDKLNEIRIRKLVPEKTPHQQRMSPQDAVNYSVQRGDISPQDADVYKAWANEADEYGNLKRPWVNAGDMRNQAAATEGRAVFSNPSFQNKSFAEKLKEIDRRMGIQNQQAVSNVMPSGNLTRPNKANTVRLSPYQEQVAVKTRFAGPNKSREEHIEAYRKQVLEVRGTK